MCNHPLSTKAELNIQMERAVRPAEAGVRQAEERLARFEADNIQSDAGQKRLAVLKKDLAVAKTRLETARGFAARLQARVQAEAAEADRRREMETTVKLLRRFGVDPKSAQKAAAWGAGVAAK